MNGPRSGCPINLTFEALILSRELPRLEASKRHRQEAN